MKLYITHKNWKNMVEKLIISKILKMMCEVKKIENEK